MATTKSTSPSTSPIPGTTGDVASTGGGRGTPLPRQIGVYRILHRIGEGGMGTVYLGEQTEPIRRQVAVKVIRSSQLDSRSAHRFEAERRALARMGHPCIAQVYEAGDTEAGQPFFAMEYVPGEPITDYCDREGLTIDERLTLFAAVCRGIHHAHQKGILHRDIKPGNILVASDQDRPVPKIIDFGVAKALDKPLTAEPVTVHGAVIGTPSYLSPESIGTPGEDADPDTRADVYSLGVLLFELLVGARPFGRAGDSMAQVLRQVAEGEVEAPSAHWKRLDPETRARTARGRGTGPSALARRLRGDLDWITLKATARQRDERYDSAAELADDVERHQRVEPVKAGPPHRFYVLGKFVRRYRATVMGTALVALALAGGIVARSLEARRANREAAAARQAQVETQQVVDFLVDLFEVNDPGSARGNTITARELLDRGAQQIQRRLGDQPLTRARLLDTIGLVYRRMDLPEPSRPLLEEALAIRERLHGLDHPEVATSLNHLGDLYWIGGHYEDAETALVRALAIREDTYGPDHLLVADVLDNLGSVYGIQAKYGAAEPVLRRALDIRERAPGPDDLRVASSLDDLGILLVDQGDGAGAFPLLERALQIREAGLGPDHPDVAASANGLAISLCLRKRYDECIGMFERALAIRETAFGPESAPVAQCLNNLGQVYLDVDRSTDAEIALRRAADIWESILGSGHPRVGIVLINLGHLHLGRDELGRAAALFRRALGILEAALGPEHPRVADALEGLGESLLAQGQDEAGLSLCRRALSIRETALGPDNPETVRIRTRCEGWAGRPETVG